jgi:AcrR family transcriptional regulator
MEPPPTPSARAAGRPRDARTDEAILSSTLELIAEHGVYELRMDDVARHAGVGKAAIYRRYGSKEELIGAAVAGLVSNIVVPDTGSTREDLVVLMLRAVAVYSDPIAAGVMPSLVAFVNSDPRLARTWRDGFVSGRREALVDVLERGVARGDLRADLNRELALDVLGGPLYYRLLVTGGAIDASLAEGVVDLVMRGFAPLTPEEQP